MLENKKTKVRLSSSLRKHIREKKSSIRREFGKNSSQMEDFLRWVDKKRKEKEVRVTAAATNRQKE